MFPSVKTGRRIACEADHERTLIEISEADPNVVWYITQPHRLEIYSTEGETLTYFPDVRRDMSDGSVEIIETKKSLSEITRDPDYKRKLELAKEIYDRKRWTFRIMAEDEELAKEPLVSNAKKIAADRGTMLRTKDVLAVQGLHSREVFTYFDAISALRRATRISQEYATAKLHALVVERFVYVDISREIGGDAPMMIIAQQDIHKRRINRRELA